MTEDAIQQLLQLPESGDFDALFDALALALLRRQARTGISDSNVANSGAGEHPSWRAVVPTPAALVPTGDGSPSDGLLLAAIREAEWRRVIVPSAAPVLLLEDLEDVSATALLPPESGSDLTMARVGQRLDGLTIRSWLASQQRAGSPAWIVGGVGSAEQLLADLDRRRLRFRLPVGSRLVIQCAYEELFDDLAGRAEGSQQALGIHPQGIRYVLHQPTLASRIAVDQKEDDRLELAAPTPWVRYRSTSSGRPEGRLVVMDLATTDLPACQQLDWRVTVEEGARFRLTLHSP